MLIFILTIYIIGCILAFGVLTGAEYRRMMNELIEYGHKPKYKTPFNSRYIVWLTFGSWFSAIGVVEGNYQEGIVTQTEYSFAKVWEVWEVGGEDHE